MPSIYEKYQLREVINASGRMTILGVSTPKPEVANEVHFGLNQYFEMKDLVNKTGAYIAGLLGVEDAVVVSCASAGIAQSVAAVIVKDDADLLFNLHSSDKQVPREIVIPKGHNVNFGAPVDTMVSLGAVKLSRRALPTSAVPISWKRKLPLKPQPFCISSLTIQYKKACCQWPMLLQLPSATVCRLLLTLQRKKT